MTPTKMAVARFAPIIAQAAFQPNSLVRGANCYLVITEFEILVIDTGISGNGNNII
jgi:hypothetical protein